MLGAMAKSQEREERGDKRAGRGQEGSKKNQLKANHYMLKNKFSAELVLAR